MPWFIQVFTRSIVARTEPLEHNVIRNMMYQSSVDRIRPSMFEIALKLKKNATTTLSFQFKKVLLRYSEYPPDANHGYDIG